MRSQDGAFPGVSGGAVGAKERRTLGDRLHGKDTQRDSIFRINWEPKFLRALKLYSLIEYSFYYKAFVLKS